MKHKLLVLCSFITLLAAPLHAQEANHVLKNTYKIEKTDCAETVLWKAAHTIPTKNQYAALQNEFIAFVHFGPNTFTRMEWGNGMEDPKIFDLKTLDTDQWCRSIRSAGMKMVLLTVKHHDGFVLWQSRYTKHGIMSCDYKNGQGDILRDLSESCKKYGLKLGIYLSPADLYQIENKKGLYGNLSPYTERTIPRPVADRPFKDTRTFRFVVDDYNEYFLNQLFELLTEYGEIHEVWFDGAHPKNKGGQRYNYLAWKELIHTLASKAVIFGREDVRWAGNEGGATRPSEWNVIPYGMNPDTANHFSDMTDLDLGSRSKLMQGAYLHYQQAEIDTSIREGWFYRDDHRQNVRSADDVFDIYERAVGGNATLLLNIPPNREGRFSQKDVAVLQEVGKRIDQTYTTDLLQDAVAPDELLDHNDDTYIEIEAGKDLVIELLTPKTLNRIMLCEAIQTHSERVEQHAIDVWVDGTWKQVASATNIGYKRILRFEDVTTTRIRLRILASRLTPAISHISAHYYRARLPRLAVEQDPQGLVHIKEFVHQFGWKVSKDAADKKKLNYEIRYTLDGSDPTSESALYQEPFRAEQGVLKAVAVNQDEVGAEVRYQLAYAKDGWKSDDLQQDAAHASSMAFDGQQDTYWKGKASQAFTLDLGKEHLIHGFAYTPQTEGQEGLIQHGVISVSRNGRQWKEIEEFEFGNLINDPTKRFHYFQKPIKARYFKMQPTRIAADHPSATIAEIDLF